MQKRDAICEAALELFAEQGIDHTTIRDIAGRANASEGALYRHFDGKADLASWLYDRCAGELRERLRAAGEGTSSPRERLEVLVRSLFDFYASRPSSCTYLLSTRPGDVDANLSAPTRVFAEMLPFAQTDRHGPSPKLQAGWIVAMVQRTVRFLKAGTLDVNDNTAIDQTVERILHLSEAERASAGGA